MATPSTLASTDSVDRPEDANRDEALAPRPALNSL
jgi:hypothetical protein